MNIATHRAAKFGALSSVALLALTACGGSDDGETTAEGCEGTNGETLTIAIANEEPYSYLDDETGEAAGGAVAIATEILCERMGYDLETELTDWDSLIPGLTSGNWDAVAAGMSITPERCEEAEFAEPELMYQTALLVEEGNPLDVHNFDDLAAAQESGEDISVVTLTAGVEATYAENEGIDFEGVGSADDGIDFVEGGRADVFALTAISLEAMAGDLSGYEVTDSFAYEVSAGSIVFPQGNDLLEEYNEHLADIKDEDALLDIVSGDGFTEDQMPPASLTTADLCGGDIDALNEEYLDD